MKKNVLITIKEDYVENLESIIKILEQYEMAINEVYPFGLITGAIDEIKLELIWNEAFVEAIESDDTISLNPPRPYNDFEQE